MIATYCFVCCFVLTLFCHWICLFCCVVIGVLVIVLPQSRNPVLIHSVLSYKQFTICKEAFRS